MAEDPRLQASGDELAAKSRIAAALIQRGALDINSISVDFSKHWIEDPALKQFNALVRRLYDVTRRNL